MFLKVFALQRWSCALFLTYFGDHALLLAPFPLSPPPPSYTLLPSSTLPGHPPPLPLTPFPLTLPSLTPCNPLLRASSRDVISRQCYLSPLWNPCILGGDVEYKSYFLGDDERLKPNSGSGTLAAVA